MPWCLTVAETGREGIRGRGGSYFCANYGAYLSGARVGNSMVNGR